jgi:hypothetical protein
MVKIRSGLVISVLCSGILSLWNSCTDSITGDRNANLPPDSFIFVRSVGGDTLNPQRSVQDIYWDGRDPDGFVKGFYYSWKNNPAPDDWIYTTNQHELFALEITGADTQYTFHLKAVDNQDLEDPTPAIQMFPIINSPPEIEWSVNSRIPDTTYTVAAFSWQASDPDGDLTISHFEYALDTPDSWHKISGLRRTVTIDADSGLSEGDHVFYIRAVDIAGATSETIRMPQNATWYVKEPKGHYLLVDDFEVESASSGRPDAYYKGMLSRLLPELGETGGFDYWNIETQFPALRSQFTETMKLFNRVIWYTDLVRETDPHFITAQVAIPEYRSEGGKIVYTVQFNTGFGVQGSPLEFSPVDSLGQYYNFLAPGAAYNPDQTFTDVFGLILPDLKVSNYIFGLIALKPKANAIPMYRYDDPNRTSDPIFVLIGQNDNLQGQPYDFVFAGTPLHMLNGNNNLDDLFRVILQDVFK